MSELHILAIIFAAWFVGWLMGYDDGFQAPNTKDQDHG